MDKDWINMVMRMNTDVVAAETLLNKQIVSLVALAEQGKNTTEAEKLIVSYRQRLTLLRTIQAQLLKVVKN